MASDQRWPSHCWWIISLHIGPNLEECFNKHHQVQLSELVSETAGWVSMNTTTDTTLGWRWVARGVKQRERLLTSALLIYLSQMYLSIAVLKGVTTTFWSKHCALYGRAVTPHYKWFIQSMAIHSKPWAFEHKQSCRIVLQTRYQEQQTKRTSLIKCVQKSILEGSQR